MAIFKVQHLFDGPVLPDGWSDTWYVSAPNNIAAQNQGRQIANARIKLLSPSWVLHYQRVTANVLVVPKPPRRQRMASLENLSLVGNAQVGAMEQDPDTPWQASIIRLSDVTQVIFRNWLIRGLPDGLWDKGDDKNAVAFFAGSLPAFVGDLIINGAGIYHSTGAGFSLTQIVNGVYERMTRRATGRPFGVPRGRR